jgi:hypothetical protein
MHAEESPGGTWLSDEGKRKGVLGFRRYVEFTHISVVPARQVDMSMQIIAHPFAGQSTLGVA